jgi:hypothetical protein
MDKKQALEIVKQVLDAASKSGLFPNLDASVTAANAYNVLHAEINKPENNE